MALSTAVTGFVLVLPVVSSGSGERAPSMALDSSATSASSESPESPESPVSPGSSAAPSSRESSPVVMGRDGVQAPTETGAAEATPVEMPAPADATQAEVPVSTGAPSPVAATAIDEDASAAPSSSSSPPPADAPPSTPAPAAAAAAAPDLETEVLALVNQARHVAGCDPLVADAGLAAVARAHSADMRDRDFFDHRNPDGLDAFDRARAAGLTNAQAENIARGPATAAAVMDSWSDRSDDLGHILDCELESLGVGVAQGPGGPWWTQVFGD